MRPSIDVTCCRSPKSVAAYAGPMAEPIDPEITAHVADARRCRPRGLAPARAAVACRQGRGPAGDGRRARLGVGRDHRGQRPGHRARTGRGPGGGPARPAAAGPGPGQAVAEALRDIAGLPDPVGEVVRGSTLANGLQIRQVRVPMGVVAHDLRGPPERDGRRGRSGAQERQRGRAARRLGRRFQQPRPGGGAALGAGGPGPAGATPSRCWTRAGATPSGR